jgi:two-component system, LytTR family, sensor kinase
MTLAKHPRLAYFGAWTLVALYFCWMNILTAPLRPLLVFNAAHFGLWALLGLALIPQMRRVPVRMHWRPWAFHVALGTASTLLVITLGHVIFFAFGGVDGPSSPWAIAKIAFLSCFHLALVTYFGMLAVVQAFDTSARARAEGLRASRTQAACVRAQLDALKIQLQPHFLFNTLHAIGSLMHYDVNTAERMLNRLSELLRMSLQETGNDTISLRRELDFVEAYVEIEKIRFEHRLAVTWDVPHALHGAAIPAFILQPLVENAIKHGVAPRAAGGRILIRAIAARGELVLEVEDDAPASLAAQRGFGIGLANTRSRLEALYGAGQRFELLRAGLGTVARVRLPLMGEAFADGGVERLAA